MISETPAERATAPRAGPRPRQPARRRSAAVVNLSASVIAVLTAAGILACGAPLPTPSPDAARLTAPASGRRSEPQDAAIVVSAPNLPLSVPGSDGRQHVEYDLLVANTAATPAALTVLEVLTADGEVLLRLDGPALVAATQPLDGTSPAAEIPGSTAAAVVVDLGLAADQLIERLTHRVGYELRGAPVDSGTGHEVSGPVLALDPRPPVMIAAPLSGPGWLTANSCCDAFTTHRAGRTPTGGDRFVKTETFAVDWIQLRGDQPFTGDGSSPGQWFGHGADVVAAADGTVVAARDGLPEQPPNSLPAGIDPTQTTGNQVIVQIRPDTWALYAHLQPGSIAVAVGDRVVAGQTLARLGNSGNSIAPHLHFGLLDGPDPGNANSVPFVLDHFAVSGAVDPASYLAAFAGTGPLRLRSDTTPAAQSGTLPLNLAVIDLR
jgi:Peptidase family M23